MNVDPGNPPPMDPDARWFTAPIAPAPVSRRYRAALALVAVAMVLLPLVYLVIVVAAGGLVVWHAVHNVGILTEGRGAGLGRLLLYGGPIIVGGIVVVFLVKPLFARASESNAAITVSHEEQPELFRFIGELCRLVGAPPPARVDVDCQINASAGFRAGFSSIFSNDLVLTIGLPLVAGMSVRQFAGVLGHEFGHFAQGGGMRLSYLIRRLNAWFARVVYDRDALDVQLDEAARSADFRIALFLHAARAAVWLSRRVLWLLMIAGHAISCTLMRQMEFDADAHEAKVAGSDAFASTMRRLTHLNAGFGASIERLREHWKERRLPDDLAEYVRHRSEQLGDERIAAIDAASDVGKTGAFDTHPSNPDRIRAVAALGEPGVCPHEGPATDLFDAFPDLSRRVTRLYYEAQQGLEIHDQNLVPEGALGAEGDQRSEEHRCLAEFAPGWDGQTRTIALDPSRLAEPCEASVLHARIAAARSFVADTLAVLEPAMREADRAEAEQDRVFAIQRLGEAKIRLKESGNIPATDPRTLAELWSHWESVGHQQVPAWTAVADTIADRLDASLRLWWRDPAPETDPTALRERRTEIEDLSRLGARLASCGPAVQRVRRTWGGLTTLFQNSEAAKDVGAFNDAADRLRGEINRAVLEIQPQVAGYWYPFPHASGRIRISDLLRPSEIAANDIHAAYLSGHAVLQTIPALHARVMAHLVALAVEAERFNGI